MRDSPDADKTELIDKASNRQIRSSQQARKLVRERRMRRQNVWL